MTTVPEWREFAIGPPGTWARQKFIAVHHVTHIGSAVRVLEDGAIKADLVFDESKLNTERIRVSSLLLSRSSRPYTKRVSTRSPMDIEILAELEMRYPRWGAGRLASKMQEHGIPISRATVGRILRQVRRRCPMCHMTEAHNPGLHALHRDLSTMRLRSEEERARWEFALQVLSY